MMLAALLGLERRSALDNPRLDLRDPAQWDAVFGTYSQTAAGLNITPYNALSYSPVWSAVQLLSGDVSKLPLEILRENPADGVFSPDKSHPSYRVVRWRAHQKMSAFTFWRRMMVHVLIWNNAYALIQRDPNSGDILSMLPLLPDRTCKDDYTVPTRTIYYSEINGVLRAFFPSEILHLQGITIEGRKDCQLIDKARDTWALGLAAENFASKFFARGGRVGGILEIPAEMSKKARDKVEAGFARTYERVDAAFMTFIARDNVKFQAAQHTFEDTQLVESRKETVKDVARFYGIPPHKLGDDSRTSYNSLEQENRSYLDTALSVWLNTIQAECWFKLLRRFEQDSLLYEFKHDVSQFLMADIETRTKVANTEIMMGTMSPDEYRAKTNRPPRPDGLGGQFLTPLNMAAGGQTVPVVEEDEEPEEDEPVDTTAEEAAAMDGVERSIRYVTGHIMRACRHKEPKKFVDWFDSGLPELSEMFHQELIPSIRPLARKLRTTPQAMSDAIADKFFVDLKRSLDIVFDTTTDDQLRDAVIAACRTLHSHITRVQLCAA